jgi:hypothetical protein
MQLIFIILFWRLSSDLVKAFNSVMVDFFSVVLSGEAVRLNEGGDSVPRKKDAWLNSFCAPTGAKS